MCQKVDEIIKRLWSNRIYYAQIEDMTHPILSMAFSFCIYGNYKHSIKCRHHAQWLPLS